MSLDDYEKFYLCDRCGNAARDLTHQGCDRCQSVTAASIQDRGRGSMILAALGVSLTLTACESASPNSEDPSRAQASSPTQSEPLEVEPVEVEPEASNKPLPPEHERDDTSLPVVKGEALDLELFPEVRGSGFTPGYSIFEEANVLQMQRNARMRPKRLKHNTPRPLYGMSDY